MKVPAGRYGAASLIGGARVRVRRAIREVGRIPQRSLKLPWMGAAGPLQETYPWPHKGPEPLSTLTLAGHRGHLPFTHWRVDCCHPVPCFLGGTGAGSRRFHSVGSFTLGIGGGSCKRAPGNSPGGCAVYREKVRAGLGGVRWQVPLGSYGDFRRKPGSSAGKRE